MAFLKGPLPLLLTRIQNLVRSIYRRCRDIPGEQRPQRFHIALVCASERRQLIEQGLNRRGGLGSLDMNPVGGSSRSILHAAQHEPPVFRPSRYDIQKGQTLGKERRVLKLVQAIANFLGPHDFLDEPMPRPLAQRNNDPLKSGGPWRRFCNVGLCQGWTPYCGGSRRLLHPAAFTSATSLPRKRNIPSTASIAYRFVSSNAPQDDMHTETSISERSQHPISATPESARLGCRTAPPSPAPSRPRRSRRSPPAQRRDPVHAEQGGRWFKACPLRRQRYFQSSQQSQPPRWRGFLSSSD